MPHFEYCSSLFFFITTTDNNKLEKSFCKSILSILKMNIFPLRDEEQYTRLLHLKILPLNYRRFKKLCKTIFNIISSNKKLSLFKYLKANKTTATRTKFIFPYFQNICMKNSFTVLSTKILNKLHFFHNSNSKNNILHNKEFSFLKSLNNSLTKHYKDCISF